MARRRTPSGHVALFFLNQKLINMFWLNGGRMDHDVANIYYTGVSSLIQICINDADLIFCERQKVNLIMIRMLSEIIEMHDSSYN